jgi:hypothetical protein
MPGFPPELLEPRLEASAAARALHRKTRRRKPQTALRFNDKRPDRKKYWRRLLNRARVRAGLRIAPLSVKGASTVENRTTDHETLQSPWTP